MFERWEPGERVVRREVWRGRPWSALPMYCVRDTADLLALYMPVGTPIGFADGEWPTPTGRHGWNAGPGTVWLHQDVLQLHRPGDAYSVWTFSPGQNPAEQGWYVNLQDAFRRTAMGIDTLDHELDLVIDPDGGWQFKDVDEFHEGIELGRFTAREAAEIEALGDRLATIIDAGAQWWDDRWKNWTPRPELEQPLALPPDWADTVSPPIGVARAP